MDLYEKNVKNIIKLNVHMNYMKKEKKIKFDKCTVGNSIKIVQKQLFFVLKIKVCIFLSQFHTIFNRLIQKKI